MKFFVYLSIAVVIGFLGVRWISDDAPSVQQNLGAADLVNSRADPGRFLIQSQQNSRHNAIRQAAQTAANAYAASPCDTANKANLVKAFSEYVETAQAAYGCTTICTTEEARAAVNTFSTTLDKRVKAALRTAFGRGGIYPADLSFKVRLSLYPHQLPQMEAQCSGPNRQPRTTSRTYSRS